MSGKTALKIPLPKGWSYSIKSAVLRTISLAHYAIVYARGWAVNSPIKCVRWKADNERLDAELALLREEMRIQDRAVRHAPRPGHLPAPVLALPSNWTSSSRMVAVVCRQTINRRVIAQLIPPHIRPHKTRWMSTPPSQVKQT